MIKVGLFEYMFKVKFLDDDKVRCEKITRAIPMQFKEESPVLGEPYLERFTEDVITDPKEDVKIELTKKEIINEYEEFGYKVLEVL